MRTLAGDFLAGLAIVFLTLVELVFHPIRSIQDARATLRAITDEE